MQYQIHTRSQHAKTNNAGFHGPDTYVAVTCAPEGVTVPYQLAPKLLSKRGIKIRYFGEGYTKYRGPKSSLGRAIAAAETWIAEQQQQEGHNCRAVLESFKSIHAEGQGE